MTSLAGPGLDFAPALDLPGRSSVDLSGAASFARALEHRRRRSWGDSVSDSPRAKGLAALAARVSEPEPSPQSSPMRPADAPWYAGDGPVSACAPDDLDLDCAVSLGHVRAASGPAAAAGRAELAPSCKLAASGGRPRGGSQLQELVDAATDGLTLGVAPLLEEDCAGGTYFLRDARRRMLGVFKPADEEPFAPHNPKEFVRTEAAPEESIKRGVAPGLGARREVAAFLLDQASSIAAEVPPTAMAVVVDASFAGSAPGGAKRGSLQSYVRHQCSAEDLGPSMFSVADVHAIGVLDVRIVNLDRHPGNILVQRAEDSAAEDGAPGGGDDLACSLDGPRVWGAPSMDRSMSVGDPRHSRGPGLRLVPIDNGLCLPACEELDDVTFCWLRWPAAKLPFGRRALAVIAQLDSWADAELLAAGLGAEDALEPRAVLWLHIGTAVLKAGAAAGLTLFQIGSMFERPPQGGRSSVEELVATASAAASVQDHGAFMAAFEPAVEAFAARSRPHSPR